MTPFHTKAATWLWGPNPKDRALLSKLDITLLPYFSLIWFLFGVTRSSYSSAYISGMKEALDFQGKDYNYMSTAYLVTYAVFQIPGTSLLTLVRPKYVFVPANVTWSVLTMITVRMTRAWQVILLNAIEGAFSAIAYVGALFTLGSWYKRSELGTRNAVFCVFGHLGSMAGGWIQAGLLETLAGKGGLPAWKWIFIIVSVMTLPVALFVYSLCVQSLSNNVMPLWMASRGYTVVQQNNYPTAIYATAIVGTLFYAALSDHLRSRWEVSIAIGLTFVIGSAILVSDPHTAGYLFAFYLLGTTYAPQAVWYSWLADVTSHDVQLRAIATGFMNSFDFAFVTWWPLVFYPVTDAPDFRRGYIASLVTGALTLPFIGVIAWLERRDRARGVIERDVVDKGSGNGNGDAGVFVEDSEQGSSPPQARAEDFSKAGSGHGAVVVRSAGNA
ncbi:uncharacterized protein DSM5745_10311 [Aspergillus mulundensis]|uniref:Major facilitator superfamily (MFS) profile domain-containing protein n=1 Tax=Aspergillus mulundensis TaxID=1810919 RepID=A0A3D8QNH9_9EURO|nr:hypothetical protein DSM5745_10311 [Aspergillus mulundensis]RDW63200.1 hypothetical protein DSM5745_10311 [Aspergillus mulundensis]